MRKSRFLESYMRAEKEEDCKRGSPPPPPEISQKGSQKALPALSLISLTHDVILEVGSYLVGI